MCLQDIELLIKEGRRADAYRLLENLLEMEPNNSRAWYFMGNLLRGKQRWGEAINAFNRAAEIDPGSPASKAVESIYDILRFQNTDLMNP